MIDRIATVGDVGLRASQTASADTEMVYVNRRSRPAPLPEFALVTLLVAGHTIEDGRHVEAGQVGTIVGVHDGGRAYDVEFSDPPGTIAAIAANVRPL